MKLPPARLPEPSKPEAKRERVAELLGRAGYSTSDGVLPAVDAWRRERITPMGSVKALGGAVIAYFDNLSAANLMPHLPGELANVPRANIDFLPIKDAWFSGSMNYLGRARNADGSPKYEASYEINASLQISFPEFQQLVSHEVVPGPRHDLRIPAEFVRSRQSRIRGDGSDHEHPCGDSVRRPGE